MKNCFLLFWLIAWVPVNTCTHSNMYLDRISSYLNASGTAEKSKYVSKNFHSFFMSKEGVGKNKSEALKSFQNWDGPMHPDISTLNLSSHDSICTVTFNEQNDFSKAIGFPGWKGTTTFVFDSAGLIEETVYVPDSSNPSYKPFLQPALNWLEKNKSRRMSTSVKFY